jgi:hypothetical protein
MKTTKRLIECTEILGQIFPADVITMVQLIDETNVRYQLNGDKPRTIDLTLFLSLLNI